MVLPAHPTDEFMAVGNVPSSVSLDLDQLRLPTPRSPLCALGPNTAN